MIYFNNYSHIWRCNVAYQSKTCYMREGGNQKRWGWNNFNSKPALVCTSLRLHIVRATFYNGSMDWDSIEFSLFFYRLLIHGFLVLGCLVMQYNYNIFGCNNSLKWILLHVTEDLKSGYFGGVALWLSESMWKLPLEVIIFFMDCRDYCSGNIFHGLHNRTPIFFTIYGVGVISEFYVATGESMEKINEPNRP